MMNKIKKVIQVVVIALLVISIVAGIAALYIETKADEREAKIRWAEAADDAAYADVKAMWKDYIENKYDVEINKVVMDIDISSYAGPSYYVTVWYRTTDGEWHDMGVKDLFVPEGIDDKLEEIISS